MPVWIMPLALAAIVGLLALATRLESTRTRITVRFSVRSKTATPELVEALVAAELAPVLEANGFKRPTVA